MNIEEKIKDMSLEQKIGQMFMARGLKFFPEETFDLIKKGLIGGIQPRKGNTREEILEIQKLSPIPLFISLGMETGLAEKGFKGTNMPYAMAIGAIGSEEYAYQWAEIAALEAWEFGANFVFGPVLDIAMDPASPMVNIRSLGSDIGEVIRLGSAMIKGYQDNGMQVSAKHYPGAGRSPVDNHIETLKLLCSKEEFENAELLIYREAIKRTGLNGIMTGHIMVPAVDPDMLSTVSKKINDYLKRIEFNGILITDSLTMKGIKSKMKPKELFARALKAGHDIILGDYTLSPKLQIEYMLYAVKDGIISEEDVNRSVSKILIAKERIKKHKIKKPVDFEKHQQMALEMSRKAVTVIGDLDSKKHIIKDKNMLFIIALEEAKGSVDIEVSFDRSNIKILELLKKKFSKGTFLIISENPNPAEIEKTMDIALQYEHIVFITYALFHSYKGTADLYQSLIALVGGLKEKIEVFILFGNPYAARFLLPLSCIMFPYLGGQAEQAAVETLAGDTIPMGKLPVMTPSYLHTAQGAAPDFHA